MKTINLLCALILCTAISETSALSPLSSFRFFSELAPSLTSTNPTLRLPAILQSTPGDHKAIEKAFSDGAVGAATDKKGNTLLHDYLHGLIQKTQMHGEVVPFTQETIELLLNKGADPLIHSLNNQCFLFKLASYLANDLDYANNYKRTFRKEVVVVINWLADKNIQSLAKTQEMLTKQGIDIEALYSN